MGSGSTAESSRLGSHDLAFQAMSGSIATATSAAPISLVKRRSGCEPNRSGLRTTTATSSGRTLIDAARAGATIKAALSAMYQEGRFLGGFDWAGPAWPLSRSFVGRRLALPWARGDSGLRCRGVRTGLLRWADQVLTRSRPRAASTPRISRSPVAVTPWRSRRPCWLTCPSAPVRRTCSGYQTPPLPETLAARTRKAGRAEPSAGSNHSTVRAMSRLGQCAGLRTKPDGRVARRTTGMNRGVVGKRDVCRRAPHRPIRGRRSQHWAGRPHGSQWRPVRIRQALIVGVVV